MHDSGIMLDHLSGLAAERLDALVDRLEDGWRRGYPPRVEDLLADATALAYSERTIVARELVLVDMELRVRAGQRLSLDDCLRIFPEQGPELSGDRELAALIEAVGIVHDAATACGSSKRAPSRSPSAATRSRPDRLGCFDLGELAGSGSFGELYRARDTFLARDVALKILRSEHLQTEDDGEWFLREARHAARLRHPGIVPVFEAGIIDGVYYLAYAYVSGGTLRARLKRGPLSFRQSADIVAQVADALAYAHRAGVVHRDVKPANILLDADEKPCLADFGLAEVTAPDTAPTFRGALSGTPAYMSPEQFTGALWHVDTRSDLYSLGVVLYELLTGQLPFLSRGRMLEAQVLNDEPCLPRRLNEHVPADLESVCLKAMAKEPAGRYLTADEMAGDLRCYLAGKPAMYCRRARRDPDD